MAQTEQYRRVGKFELHELIGEGAMGGGWRADDSVTRRYVALKLLSRAGRSADARDRLLREARAAGALQHPNIVTIYDLGEADGQLFIAMELVDGRDLSTLIALSEPLPLERKLDLVIEVLQGLSYAHERGVIHRDIKPSNIVTIYDLGEANGHLFTAMGLVDGRDLSTLIALSEPLPLERKLDLVIEVLQGLSYAHE